MVFRDNLAPQAAGSDGARRCEMSIAAGQDLTLVYTQVFTKTIRRTVRRRKLYSQMPGL